MNEVKCYTVAIPNFPLILKKEHKKLIENISKYEGFVGVHPCYPRGTILIFKTKNDAKRARNRLKGIINIVGNNVGEVYIDERYVKAGGIDE